MFLLNIAVVVICDTKLQTGIGYDEWGSLKW